MSGAIGRWAERRVDLAPRVAQRLARGRVGREDARPLALAALCVARFAWMAA